MRIIIPLSRIIFCVFFLSHSFFNFFLPFLVAAFLRFWLHVSLTAALPAPFATERKYQNGSPSVLRRDATRRTSTLSSLLGQEPLTGTNIIRLVQHTGPFGPLLQVETLWWNESQSVDEPTRLHYFPAENTKNNQFNAVSVGQEQ